MEEEIKLGSIINLANVVGKGTKVVEEDMLSVLMELGGLDIVFGFSFLSFSFLFFFPSIFSFLFSFFIDIFFSLFLEK